MAAADDSHSLADRHLEVERHLPGDGIDQRPPLPELKARTGAHRHRLQQRVRHARHLLHGGHGAANALDGNARGSQITELAELYQLVEAVALARLDQPGALPGGELATGQAEDTQHIFSAVAAHGGSTLGAGMDGAVL